MNPAEFEQIAQYRVRRLIGEGAAGWVFEVERQGRACALKLLKPRAFAQGGPSGYLMRFQREIRIQQSIVHDALLPILDAGASPLVRTAGASFSAPFYYAMPLLDTSLAERLGRGGDPGNCLAEADIERVFVPVLSALEALHERAIVHRDVKPANILLDRDGRPFLADLGAARELHQDATQTGTLLGSPLWMSPEQAAASKEVGPASDLYSLGLALYRALVGRHAYELARGMDAGNPEAVRLDIVAAAMRGNELGLEFPDPRTAPGIAAVSFALQSVVRKALRLDPADRYPSAAALREDLVRALRAPRAIRPERIVRAGPYEVRHLIGEGRFAWVFEIERAGERCAFKVFKPAAGDAGASDARASALQSAFELQERAAGPGALRVLGRELRPVLSEGEGQPQHVAPFGLLMPLARPLADVHADARLPLASVQALAGPLLGALARLHRAGGAHGDLRPRSVWLEADGQVRLGDVRVRALGAGDEPTHACVEERAWCAPEELAGAAPSVAGDLYSMGLTLCWAVAGGRPARWLEGARLAPILPSIDAPPEAASTAERLGEVLRRAALFEPTSRPRSAREMARQLARALRSPRRRSAPRIAAYAAAAALLVAGLLLPETPAPPPPAKPHAVRPLVKIVPRKPEPPPVPVVQNLVEGSDPDPTIPISKPTPTPNPTPEPGPPTLAATPEVVIGPETGATREDPARHAALRTLEAYREMLATCAWERAPELVSDSFRRVITTNECSQIELQRATLRCDATRCTILAKDEVGDDERIQVESDAGTWKVTSQVAAQ